MSNWKLSLGGFPVIAETTRNHTFSKEISQVMLAAMVLVPDFYCKNCQRVISAMRGNPPLARRNFDVKQALVTRGNLRSAT